MNNNKNNNVRNMEHNQSVEAVEKLKGERAGCQECLMLAKMFVVLANDTGSCNGCIGAAECANSLSTNCVELIMTAVRGNNDGV